MSNLPVAPSALTYGCRAAISCPARRSTQSHPRVCGRQLSPPTNLGILSRLNVRLALMTSCSNSRMLGGVSRWFSDPQRCTMRPLRNSPPRLARVATPLGLDAVAGYVVSTPLVLAYHVRHSRFGLRSLLQSEGRVLNQGRVPTQRAASQLVSHVSMMPVWGESSL